MLIKILYILGIFLVIKLVVNSLSKYDSMQTEAQAKKQQQKKNEDAIDAEYTVVDEPKD